MRRIGKGCKKDVRLFGKKMAGKKWAYLLPPIFLPPFRRQTDSLTSLGLGVKIAGFRLTPVNHLPLSRLTASGGGKNVRDNSSTRDR